FKDGDYSKCVQHFFNVKIVNDEGSSETPDETPVTPTPTPSDDETPAPTPTPDETPVVVNHAPVAQIAGPIGAVEAGAQVSLSAEGSTDPDGNTLTYTWRSQDGQTVTGQDKAV
ncbi:PKD domain-containing protein, partial [Klebsiella pneumoniae]